jgi:hypothetical protein
VWIEAQPAAKLVKQNNERWNEFHSEAGSTVIAVEDDVSVAAASHWIVDNLPGAATKLAR